MPLSRPVNPRSKTLVIDASIARAAGGEDAQHPDATHARDFLKAVLNICHKIGMTPAIKKEWDDHESRFALSWRKAMVARKKLAFKPLAENAYLREAVMDLDVTEKAKSAMLKDCHLLEAALAFDGWVFSADEIVRCHFQNAAVRIPEIRRISWGNPLKETTAVLEGLAKGEPRKTLSDSASFADLG